MVILNKWPDKIDQNVIDLLTKYLEKRSGCGLRSGSSLPQEATRYVYHTFRNKLGEQCFRMETVTGVAEGRSTSPKFHTRVDEFGYAFRSLTDKQQLLILGYADPFDELNDKDEFRQFLTEIGIGKEQEYWKLLEEAFVVLQKKLEKRGLAQDMTDILTGWDQVAGYLQLSLPTVKKLAKEGKIYISRLGGRIISSKSMLEKNLQDIVAENNYNNGGTKVK